MQEVFLGYFQPSPVIAMNEEKKQSRNEFWIAQALRSG
jgi:hypothetical protein